MTTRSDGLIDELKIDFPIQINHMIHKCLSKLIRMYDIDVGGVQEEEEVIFSVSIT